MHTLGKFFLTGLLFFHGSCCASNTPPKMIKMIETGYRFKDLPYGVPANFSEPQGFKVDTREQVLQRFKTIQQQFAQDYNLPLDNDQSKIMELCSVRYCMFLRNSGYVSDVYWGYVDQAEKPTTPKKTVRRSVSYPYYFRK
jgi:hypothetical protein